ncbi:MAG: hypothetical protein QM537_08635, partial [Candidatus Symbiobacter sp.]|nr:hypothetical protein [Candidatus Symbiobacter sp.]
RAIHICERRSREAIQKNLAISGCYWIASRAKPPARKCHFFDFGTCSEVSKGNTAPTWQNGSIAI